MYTRELVNISTPLCGKEVTATAGGDDFNMHHSYHKRITHCTQLPQKNYSLYDALILPYF